MKKIFSYIGISTLTLMSFITLEKTTTVIKLNDEIMMQINEQKNKYEQEPIDAKIDGNKIEPGINGKKININKSYENMKKMGKYNPEKYEYDQIQPKISINNIHDKYIEKGNSNKKEIALIIIDKNNKMPIIKEIIEKQKVKVTILKNNTIEINNNNFTQIDNTKQKYCYIKEETSKELKKCEKQKKHTIKMNIVEEDLLKETKKTLSNGKIITISLNENTQKELELTINYIKSKGYKIVKLEELLSEKNTN